MLACCDKELLGKTLKEGIVEFSVSENFYKDVLVDAQQLKQLLEETKNANLVGEKAVNTAVQAGMAAPSSVRYIQGVPHILIFKF